MGFSANTGSPSSSARNSDLALQDRYGLAMATACTASLLQPARASRRMLLAHLPCAGEGSAVRTASLPGKRDHFAARVGAERRKLHGPVQNYSSYDAYIDHGSQNLQK